MLKKLVPELTFNKKTSYGLALSSGILLLLSFPPFGFGGFLAWIALVPILVALYYEKSAKRSGRLILVFGLCLLPLFLFLYSELEVFGVPTLLSWLIALLCSAF
jgi:hypothetical protein